MGAVYLAQDLDGRRVALKVIRSRLGDDPEFRARFRSEVSRARQVPPFCTAAVLDADPDHPTPYLVVEYVPGADLEHLVRDQGPLRGGNLQSVAIGVATALAAIHTAGVIHRDLKPSNVLFALGAPKVIDFGIARAAESPTEHTRTGHLVGTIAYMAPERFETGPERPPAGPAADIFAWGVLVAYAATGRTPFAADSPMATAARILTQEPDLSGLSGPLGDLVAAALRKDPAARPTAHALLDRLLRQDAGDLAERPHLRWAALAARNNGPAAEVPRPRRVWPRRAALAAATVVPAVTAAILLAVFRPAVTPVATDPPATVEDLALPWAPIDREDATGSCFLGDDGDVVVQQAVTQPFYQCPARDRRFTAITVSADVTIPNNDRTCAAVWLLSGADGAYRMTMCRDRFALVVDGPDHLGQAPLATARVGPASFGDVTLEVEVAIAGGFADVRVDGRRIIHEPLGADGPKAGGVYLGLVRGNTAGSRYRSAAPEQWAVFRDLQLSEW